MVQLSDYPRLTWLFLAEWVSVGIGQFPRLSAEALATTEPSKAPSSQIDAFLNVDIVQSARSLFPSL